MEDLQAFLAQQRQTHMYRERKIVDGPQSVSLQIEGKHYINFCSNDYLGLANHPRVVDAFMRGAKLYGVGSGASHLINGHSAAHHQLEEELAEFVNRPRALLFSTGYMANTGVISALMSKGDSVFEDRWNHASLLDGALLSQARLQRYQHNDVEDLQIKLESSKAKNKLVCTDGVFSMDGDVARLKDIASLCKQHDAWFMVDDAHGLAATGATGRGSLEEQDVGLTDVPILVGTLGKGFGTFGAFAAGSEELIETLIQRARSYIYTTALPPAIAEATRASLRVVQQETWRREALLKNIQYFRQQMQIDVVADVGSLTPIQPVIIGDVEQTLLLSEKLKAAGILVSAIRPPTVPEGTARLRITLCAEHDQQQIDQLVDVIQTNLQQKAG